MYRPFTEDLAWALAGIVAAYVLSRGIAKAGSGRAVMFGAVAGSR
jgi:hypothetical protein